jgi:hypothetical protein
LEEDEEEALVFFIAAKGAFIAFFMTLVPISDSSAKRASLLFFAFVKSLFFIPFCTPVLGGI